MVLGTQSSAVVDVQITKLMEPAGTVKDGCMPSRAHGTTWAYSSYNKRGSSMYGFATVKVKPIYD